MHAFTYTRSAPHLISSQSNVPIISHHHLPSPPPPLPSSPPTQNCHMNIGHMQEVGASLCDAVLQFSIAENLIKDVLIVPQVLKSKTRAESTKSESDGKDLTCVGNLRDITREMRDVLDTEQSKEGSAGVQRRPGRREKKYGSLTLASMAATSYTVLSDISAASGSSADNDNPRRSPAMDGKARQLRLRFLFLMMPASFFSPLLFSSLFSSPFLFYLLAFSTLLSSPRHNMIFIQRMCADLNTQIHRSRN